MDRDASNRCAAIDLGSHSAKLTIARRSPRGWKPDVEQVEITGLGRGEPGRVGLDPGARQRALEILTAFAGTIDEHGVDAVVVAGTAVMRNAVDAGDFVDLVQSRTGLLLEIIPGKEEARLTYLGAVDSLPTGEPRPDQLVFDIGGASTELAWGSRLAPDDRRSLDVGTIALSERFGLSGAANLEQLNSARVFVADALATLPDVPAPARLVGIGATPATLLALDRGRDIADSHEIHGQPLRREIVAAQIERLRGLDTAQRRELPGLHPDRAGVVLAGAAITDAIARRWSDAPLILSGSGLRAGLMLDRFGDGR